MKHREGSTFQHDRGEKLVIALPLAAGSMLGSCRTEAQLPKFCIDRSARTKLTSHEGDGLDGKHSHRDRSVHEFTRRKSPADRVHALFHSRERQVWTEGTRFRCKSQGLTAGLNRTMQHGQSFRLRPSLPTFWRPGPEHARLMSVWKDSDSFDRKEQRLVR